MRTKPFVAPAQEKPAEAEKSKTTTPPVSTTPPVFPKKIPDWQVLVDDLPTE